jgi:membrane-bound lytic murein transglycosylase D
LQPAPSHLQVLLLSTAICTVPLLSGCALLPENSVRATIEETSVEHIPENTAINATETLIAEVYSEQSVIVSDQIKPAEKPIPLVIEEIAEPEPMDLWQRIREGYNLTPESMPASVTKQRDWYLRNPSYLKTVFSRAQPYIYYVTDELDKAGLPLELALLPIVESTYDPLAYSHSHAVGLWQFIPSTGKSLGLRRDRWYDGRRDVIYSTQAAITYLKKLNKRFDNDWLLALAAYNSGQGFVSKSIRRNRKLGKGTDFWSISLPRETRNYVPQLLALATLIRDPEKYDLRLPAMPNEPFFEVVEIESQIDLNNVVKVTGIEVGTFTRLNPAYRRAITPPQGKHNLLLPVGSAQPLRDMLATTDPKTWVPHTEYAVANGDTLSHIAARFDIPTSWLRSRNNLRNDRLQIGQVLLIPHSRDNIDYLSNSLNSSKQPVYHSVRQGDSLWTIAKKYDTSISRLRKINKLSSNTLRIGDRLIVGSRMEKSATKNLRKLSYRVRRGDSLSLIASKFDIAIRDITRWNKISRNDLLQPGQRLTLFIDGLRN